MAEGKKISFGFMKTKKVEKLPLQEKKDFIECVEEKAIKVIGVEEVKDVAPLVIPMKPNTLITAERLKEIAEKVESSLEEPASEEKPKPMEVAPENETLDQMAVRELLEDSKKAVKIEGPELKLVLPSKASVPGGEKESSLHDYESVPIQEFGLAMLRGMGWSKTNEKSTFKQPQLRPKGLGLGADKVVKENNKQKASKNSKEEDLTIVKNAFVKITSGKHSGYYGKVLSLDEDNGRVMVDITVKKETISLSEFMMHPVTKSEFDKESKVINAGSYEQYKKEELTQSKSESAKESDKNNRGGKQRYERDSSSSRDNNNKKTEKDNRSENRDSNDKHRDRSRDKRHSSEERYRKSKKRYSSNDSLSGSDTERNKVVQKSKKHYSSMESLDSDTERKKARSRSRKNSRERNRYDSGSDSGREREDRRTNKNTERKKYDSGSDTDQRKSKKDKERKKCNSDDERKNKDKERRRHDSDSEEDRKRKKKKERKRRDSSSESDRASKKSTKERKKYNLDQDDSDNEKRRKKDKKQYNSDSESDYKSTRDVKRDIDKKRKGKKKKRDRDRSPNYKKHRK